MRTVIGVGSTVAGDAKAHGAAYGIESVKSIKQIFDMNPEEHFVPRSEVYGYFKDIKVRGEKLEEDWKRLVAAFGEKYPELHKEFTKRVSGTFTEG